MILKCTIQFCSVAVLLVLLSGCATLSPRNQAEAASLEESQMPFRVFFGHLIHTMENHRVSRGMRELEDLLFERFPDGLRDQDGEVPEEYLAAIYRDASQGDRHITEEEFVLYKDRFLQEVEYALPDPLRVLRRRR